MVQFLHTYMTTRKARGGGGIPAELFQILKDDAVKELYSICQKICKTRQWPQDRNRLVLILIQKKSNAKECSNYCTTDSIFLAQKSLRMVTIAMKQS